MADIIQSEPFQAKKDRIALELSTDKEMQDFFSLTEREIFTAIKGFEFSDRGIYFSPSFSSPGYRNSKVPTVLMSDIDPSIHPYMHESRHGLHYTLCKNLFEGESLNSRFFKMFKENVLDDTQFVNLIETKGFDMQKKMIKEAEALFLKNPTAQEIAKNSILLGALTYQHAFFIDPGICEAVASYKDQGHIALIDTYNRFWGFLIPGEDYLEGYGNSVLQKLFQEGALEKKALLIKKSDYHGRTKFFEMG